MGEVEESVATAGTPIVVHAYRAQPLAVGRQPNPVTIVVDGSFPDGLDYDAGDQQHWANAGAIARALHDSLPGGTWDRLVAQVLYLHASHLQVARRPVPEPDVVELVPAPRSGWTSHGHPYGPAPLMHLKPRKVAKCGGPGICLGCSVDATRAGGA